MENFKHLLPAPPEVLAALLTPPLPPGEDRFRECKLCGEEWALPVGLEICPKCQMARTEAAMLRWRQEHRRGLLVQMGVPYRLLPPAEVAAWPQDPQHPDVEIQRWQGDPWCLTFQGAPGTGKSEMAVELAYAWLCRDLSLERVAWIRGAQLVGAALRREAPAARAYAAQLLILEDLGPGLNSGSVWSIVSELLAQRRDRQAPTIVTTSLSLTTLKSRNSRTAHCLTDGLICETKRAKRSRRKRQ